MKKVVFSSLDVRTGDIALERQFREMIEANYTAAAIDASNELKNLFDENINTVQDGYFGSYLDNILSRVNRYVYIKNKKANGEDSENSDVCIDLITHKFWTLEH